MPEDLLWEYVIQLVSALRVVHSSGLALGCIHGTKVLLSGKQWYAPTPWTRGQGGGGGGVKIGMLTTLGF